MDKLSAIFSCVFVINREPLQIPPTDKEHYYLCVFLILLKAYYICSIRCLSALENIL